MWAKILPYRVLKLLEFQGVATRQHDAFSIGLTTTDDFQNADVLYEDTLPAIKAALTRPPGAPKAIPVVTGFLGRGINTGTGTIVLANGQYVAAARAGASAQARGPAILAHGQNVAAARAQASAQSRAPLSWGKWSACGCSQSRGISTGTGTAILASVQHVAAARDVLDMALAAAACLLLCSGGGGVLQVEGLMLGR